MDDSDRKLIQYLAEAHASEIGMTRALGAQILLAPRGSYRRTLESHQKETHDHAAPRAGAPARARGRRRPDASGRPPRRDARVSQVLAVGKVPLELVRGSGGEEKVLKDAKDACASEALEIATYTAIEQTARTLGDESTARLAASIRAEEERALSRLLKEIPRLADAVIEVDVEGNPSYELGETGAADRVRDLADGARETVRPCRPRAAKRRGPRAGCPASQGLRARSRAPSPPRQDLPIAGYGDLTAEEIARGCPACRRSTWRRSTPMSGAARAAPRSSRGSRRCAGSEPWPGYDEMTVAEVRERLGAGDEDRARSVRSYERAHKNRAGVIDAAERERATA